MTETYEDSPVPWEEAWELFSWHISDGIWKLNLKPSYHLVRGMEVRARYFGGIVEGNYPIDRSQHALQEIRRLMKGDPKAMSQMIAVEDQIMSLKTVRRFFDNAMLNARHYRKKCARAILDGRYSSKQLEFIESECQSRVSYLEAHWELTFSATSYAQSCLDQFKHSWKGGNKLFFPHHRLDRVESYISELLDNLRDAANSDTPNVIQHDR